MIRVEAGKRLLKKKRKVVIPTKETTTYSSYYIIREFYAPILTHLLERFGSFCHPVFGQVPSSPDINVLKFEIILPLKELLSTFKGKCF